MAEPAISVLALLGLCAAYHQGGLDKAFDFAGAVNEMQHFGLAPAVPQKRVAAAPLISRLQADKLTA